MKWGWIGTWLISMETVRAENRVMKTLSGPPDYRVSGPLVSVIIPAYNEEGYIPSLFQSLVNQTYSDIEVIVVDNESTDRTVDIARSYDATVSTYSLNGSGFNPSRARNIGAAQARGSLLAFIDADTVLEATVIEKSVEEILNGANLVSTNTCCTDDHLQSLARVAAGLVYPPHTHGCYTMLPRDVFDAIGGWNEEWYEQVGVGEEINLGNAIAHTFGNTVMLRTVYVGTSGRRYKELGYMIGLSDWINSKLLNNETDQWFREGRRALR